MHYVGPLTDLLYDITWASNGKLYGINNDGTKLYEINPNTAELTLVINFTNYSGANGMTSDANGNLYLAAMVDDQNTGWYVIKYNIATGTITKVANISAEGLTSGGDLTFLNGKLYVACWDNKFAVIDINTGKITVQYLANTGPFGTSMGLITMGDGFLYVCAIDKIHRIDPVSMNFDFAPFFEFHVPDMLLFGLSNYSEMCSAPICRPKLDIDTISPLPFCSATGVQLSGNGSGMPGEANYEWTFPDKTTKAGADVHVTIPGTYYLHYAATHEACDRWDSINIQITPTPWIDLGADRLVCKNSSVELAPQSSGGIDKYTWNNGSLSAVNIVQGAGLYWVQAENSCGNVRDTMIISETGFPQVYIGADLLICPGTTVNLNNQQPRKNGDVYTWQDGSANEIFNTTKNGLYWLQNENVCGAARDSILISLKDSCTCFPFYPKAELGNDMAICPYESVILYNKLHQNGFKYSWQSGNTNSTITTKTPAIYWVDVTTYCGSVRDTIIVVQKTSGCERKVMVPSAFTPNSDGLNDIFKPVVTGTPANYEFIIYNRWGQIVYRTKTPGEGWDGTINGKKQDTNVYVWGCTYRFEGEAERFDKGKVTLIH